MFAIRNFGHFWSQDAVDWGSPGKGNKGRLAGFARIEREDVYVDFREQVGIYVLYGENREVVYLGQTGYSNQKMFTRLKQHTNDHLRGRWQNFSWFGFLNVNMDWEDEDEYHYLIDDEDISASESITHRDILDEVEAVLLQLFEPRLNKQGPRWRGTQEFLQHTHNEYSFEDDILERLERLEQRL